MKMFKYGLSVLLFLMFANTLLAQKVKSPKKSNFYSYIISKKAAFTSYDLNMIPISQKSESINYSKSLHYAEHYEIDNPIDIKATNEVPHFVEIDIPFKNKIYHCILERNYIQSPTYHLKTSRLEKRESVPSIFYRGIVEGQYQSWATLAIIDGKYRLLVAHHNGNIEVNHVEKGIYSIYESRDQKYFPEVVDDHDDHSHNHDHSGIKSTKKSDSRLGSDCLEVYVECDFQSYVDNGSSVANTEAWVMSIMNDVSTIYAGINISIVVSEIFVWNSSDPYQGETSLTAVRDSFVEQVQNGYTGRVAQLFSTRPLSGGLAYGIGGLCGEYPAFPGPYFISTELSTNFDPFPNFSYTVNVVAHELGHVMGARHTHACVWGANLDTQIDDCGNVYAINNGGTPEGTGCFDEMNPILPMSGTIMSFCNLSGEGINLSDGFGTEVGDYIFEQYNTAICATGDECASIPPSNDNCANAKLLNVTGLCSYFSYDNILATASGVANPSCGSPGIGQDVWFTIVPPNPDVSIVFNPIANEVENVIITAYTGDCGNLTEIQCEEIFNVETEIKLNGLTPNDTVFIRIIEDGSNVEGSFELCVVDANLPCHPAINALVDLYNNTNGANWTNNTGWVQGAAGTDCTPCNWYGIKCDNLENVIEVDLFNNNLNGTVPTTMEDLTKLRTIKLFLNNLTGNFPDIWSNMADLEFIDLSNNQFTGTMPSSLGGLQKLNTLYIENNDMTGGLLPEIGNLPLINVYWGKGNNFSGCFPGTYLNLCDIGSITFDNNPLLPNSGELDLFCDDGTGGDVDEDGFCFGSGVGDDCVDSDNTIYPNAPELCDGKDNDCDGQFDEGVTASNTWLPSGGGDWQVTSNWSQGTLPKPCEDIIIPASGAARTITIPASTLGFGRSLTIGSNSQLTIDGGLEISGSDGEGVILDLNGTIINNGMLDVFNIQNTGINVSGLIENYGTINVSNLTAAFELLIGISGQVDNKNGSQITLERP